MENIFETAVRTKLRFSSIKGALTVEDIWDLNLTSLDTLARSINAELRAETDDSFIPRAKANPKRAGLELRLEILKHVIRTKVSEAEAATLAQSQQSEIRKLEDVLARKRDSSLESLSVEELEAKLKGLRGL
jgi:hypothetical protein